MTTGNDGAQPAPGDDREQQPNPAEGTGAGAQAQTPVEAPGEDDADDIDAQELRDAAAAVEAEEAGGGDDPAKPAQPGNAQGAQAQPQDQPGKDGQQQPAADQPMIPKARLDEALSRLSKAELELAHQRGRAEALSGSQQQPGKPGDPAATTQPPAQRPTADQRIADLRKQQRDLASQFDDGTLTAADWEAKRAELDDKIAGIRDEAVLAKAKPANAPQADDSLYMETLTAQLETAHPWTKVFDALGDEANVAWNFVAEQARANIRAAGVDISTALGKYKLREEAAALADKFGPSLIGDIAKSKGIALPGQTQAPQQQQQQLGAKPAAKAPLSPIAEVRRQKNALAAVAAPNLENMGGVPANNAELSEAGIEAMDESALESLSDDRVNQLLGIR